MINLNSMHRKLATNVVASADEVNLRKEKCDDTIPGCVGLGAECASFPTNSVLASGNNAQQIYPAFYIWHLGKIKQLYSLPSMI